MVWRKKCKALRVLLVVLCLALSAPHAQQLRAQAPTAQEQLWSDEDWEKSKKGLDYSTEQKKKKEKKEPTQKEDSRDWNIAEFLMRLTNSNAFKILSIVIIIGLLVFIIIRLIKTNSTGKGKRVPDLSVKEALQNVENDLPDADLSHLLNMTIDAEDYKSAIRILYLHIIQQLNAHNHIVWKKDKTNNDYVREMRTHSSYQSFREVTLLFEVIWYGDTDINESLYHKVEPVFKNYLATLKNEH
jgi:hypothetical protein